MKDNATIKTIIAFVGSFLSFMVDGLGAAFVVLLGLMVFDFITGMMAAVHSGQGLSSNVGGKGLFKKLYIIILIGAVYMVELYVIKSNGIIGDGATICYCAIEFISIVENGGKLGVPIPKVIQNMITVLKGKEDTNG